ncbi:flavin reductase, partial [Streptomyces sp. NPDC006356]
MPTEQAKTVAPEGAFRTAAPEQRAAWWRSVMGQYPTGVAIVSAVDDQGRAHGLVVGTFGSVSMDPPLVSFMPMRSSRSYTAMRNVSRFRVSVLGAGHEDLCRSFASADPESRFSVGNWTPDAHGVPHLDDAVVWFDCLRVSTTEAGDHDIVLGEVQDLGFGNDAAGTPLLFLQGGYGSFAVPRLEFDADHLGAHLRIVDQAREIIDELAEGLDAVVSLCTLAQDSVMALTAVNLQPGNRIPSVVGATFPFAAPMAPVFAAWCDASRAALWRRAGRGLGFADDEVLETMLGRIREHGYAISVGPAMADRFTAVAENPRRGEKDLRDLWADVAAEYKELGEAPDWHAHVNSLQVPVFGPNGTVDLAIVLT